MVNDIAVGATVRSTLTSIQRSRENADRTSLRLASGLRVNGATDNSQNYFAAKSLRNLSSNYTRLLDGMALGVRTIQEALSGVEALESILRLTELKALEAKEALQKTTSALPDAILADSPVGYFRLNDANGTTAFNLGTLGAGGDGTYTNGVTQSDEILFFGAGGLAAKFDGTNQYVAVPNDDSINTSGPFPERTVELIFNADSTSGRQVLWEEGGTVNSLNIYIDDGVLRVNGRTTSNGGYGPLDISVPIEAGVTYHVAFIQDGPNGRFAGYLNGEQFGSASIGGFIGNHPNRNGIGAVNNNVYFHDDGPGNSPGRGDGTFAFSGQISDVAIYNSIISASDIAARYEATSLPLSEQYRQETLVFLEQISSLVEDANFRGINLLAKDDLTVDFNHLQTSQLKLDGQDFGLEALELDDVQFQKPSQVEAVINNVRKAIDAVRDFGTKLSSDVAIIQTRQDFTRNIINTYESGASDLTIADLNEEGANLLSSQTRLDLGITTLGLGIRSTDSILTVFGSQSPIFA